MPRTLIVDDGTAGCRTLQLHLQAQGHATTTAHSLDDGLAAALAETPDLIIMDIRMPGRSGLDGLPELKGKLPATRVIMITAFHDMESTIEALQKGAEGLGGRPLKPALTENARFSFLPPLEPISCPI